MRNTAARLASTLGVASRESTLLDVSRRELADAALPSSLILTTLTNTAYLPYTRNLIRSLEPLGLAQSLIAFCVDEGSLGALRAEGIRAHRVDAGFTESSFQEFHEGRCQDLVRNKLVIVHELLRLGFSVLFTDGDIVFLKNPIEELLRIADGADLLIQNGDRHDIFESKTKRINLCTGFFLARPTRRSIRAFDPKRFTSKYPCDQTYFNEIKAKAGKIRVLDRDDYPNGSWFLQRPGEPTEASKNRARIVHFNWLIGSEKVDAMRAHSMWFEAP